MKSIKDWFKKDVLNTIAVELSIGTIHIKEVTNGIHNDCLVKSCIVENVKNDAFYFQQMDYELTNMSKSRIDNLSVSDGEKLRGAVRGQLLKNGLITIEKEESVKGVEGADFSGDEVLALQKMNNQIQEETNKWLQNQ